MSEDWHKKDAERRELDAFIVEYSLVTGRRFTSVRASERPDFTAVDADGRACGLEIVRVLVDPNSRFIQEALRREEYMDPLDTAIRLQELVSRKDASRLRPEWQHPDRTLLILSVHDAPLSQVVKFLDDELIDELESTGFSEIWAADFTILSAFYTVQLLGIKPRKWRGLHQHHSRTWKPYG